MRILAPLALSLALWAGGIAAADEPTLVVSDDPSRLVLTELSDIESASLTLEGIAQGITLRIQAAQNGETHLLSPWPLIAGQDYEVSVEAESESHLFQVAYPPDVSLAPGVHAVVPGPGIIPENLLRLHIFFETPMARGQARDHIHLQLADGTAVRDAFLNLGVEIWSPDQRRLTLLFDPGRIKQGVGPNRALGAPLISGNAYKLVIEPEMVDARGNPLATRIEHPLTVGPPERRAIEFETWRVDFDEGILSLDFGRLMDAASVARYVAIQAPDGSYIMAKDATELTWDLSDWPSETPMRLIASPLLEDAAGNTLCAAFDVAMGAATHCTVGEHFQMEIIR